MIGNVELYFQSGWVIYEHKTTADTMGGFTQVSTSQASLSGLMRPLTGDYRLSADKETAFATHRFYCEPTTELTPGRFLSTGGTEYEVKFASDIMNMGRLMQVDCEAIG